MPCARSRAMIWPTDAWNSWRLILTQPFTSITRESQYCAYKSAARKWLFAISPGISEGTFLSINIYPMNSPTCGRGNTRWVFVHWYETGTWSGESCGLEPKGTPLKVEGQTRFFVSDDLQITDLVVTRTFSDWEKNL